MVGTTIEENQPVRDCWKDFVKANAGRIEPDLPWKIAAEDSQIEMDEEEFVRWYGLNNSIKN